MSAFWLIEAERANCTVSLMRRTLGVSRGGYYDWKDRPPSRRSREDAALTERINEIHHRSWATYGLPRVYAEPRAIGIRCSQEASQADAQRKTQGLPPRP